MLKKVQKPKDLVGCRGARAAEWGAELIASALALGLRLALAPESGAPTEKSAKTRARAAEPKSVRCARG